ncbi:transposase [Cereibacter changlensis]|jgi:transposase|uniref:Transposase n=1 Tax=Cereibacter changlensis TaxID=402884 RepID=A0A4U0YU90_9RHOB|nr:transposase [Cereibacter changlensis]
MDWVEADAMLQGRHEDGDYRRIEVITGKRRRRNWTAEEKARIVAESAEPGASISDVARRWGVNRGLLTVWRRHVGLVQARPACGTAQGLHFVPISIADDDPPLGRNLDATVSGLASDPPGFAELGRIEVEIGRNRMVVTGRVDPAVAAAMVAALRRSR